MKIAIAILAVIAVATAEEVTERSAEDILNDGNNQFTAKMFSEVAKTQPDKSFVISAFSVLTPLSLLSLASVGETHDELLRAIGFPNDNATKAVFSMVNSRLRAIKGVELKMANRIYIPENYELNDNFAAVSKDVFGSEVQNVDFKKNDETAKSINTWVESQTNDRIKDLVDPSSLSAATRAVLVNALYFKGTWKDEFKNENTKDRDFHVSKDKTIQVPTMNRRGNYLYGESADLNAKLLEIIYEGDDASFLVILPNEVDGLPALVEKLKDPAVLKTATAAMQLYEVDVYLPKFKVETKTNLLEILQKIDVTRIFSAGAANLKNLLKTDEGLFVSDAVQKAFLEISEKGTEAAAANVFGVVATSAFIVPSSEFKADHPFVFQIKERDTILFNGIFQS